MDGGDDERGADVEAILSCLSRKPCCPPPFFVPFPSVILPFITSSTPLLSNGYDVRLLIWRLRVRVPPGVVLFSILLNLSASPPLIHVKLHGKAHVRINTVILAQSPQSDIRH